MSHTRMSHVTRVHESRDTHEKVTSHTRTRQTKPHRRLESFSPSPHALNKSLHPHQQLQILDALQPLVALFPFFVFDPPPTKKNRIICICIYGCVNVYIFTQLHPHQQLQIRDALQPLVVFFSIFFVFGLPPTKKITIICIYIYACVYV